VLELLGANLYFLSRDGQSLGKKALKRPPIVSRSS